MLKKGTIIARCERGEGSIVVDMSQWTPNGARRDPRKWGATKFVSRWLEFPSQLQRSQDPGTRAGGQVEGTRGALSVFGPATKVV
jgi:hypothetical protein